MKIMVCGQGRHGKDTFARLLGVPFQSSSDAALAECIWPEIGHEYVSKLKCFEDRHNRREEWFNIITAYNTPDKTRLARHIFQDSSVYVGCRNQEEFYAAKEAGLFDLAIWVNASGRVPAEGKSSCTVLSSDCDIIVDNNGNLDQLHQKAKQIGRMIFHPHVQSLGDLICTWADNTFPDRTVADAFNKMVFEEIPEFFRDQSADELADIGILLYDVANLVGVDLDQAIRDKMVINKKRTWKIDPVTRIARHVEEQS